MNLLGTREHCHPKTSIFYISKNCFSPPMTYETIVFPFSCWKVLISVFCSFLRSHLLFKQNWAYIFLSTFILEFSSQTTRVWLGVKINNSFQCSSNHDHKTRALDKPSNINSTWSFFSKIFMTDFPCFPICSLQVLRVTTIFWKVCVRNRNHKLKWHSSKSASNSVGVMNIGKEGDFRR